MSRVNGTSLDALPAITPDEIRDRQRRAASCTLSRTHPKRIRAAAHPAYPQLLRGGWFPLLPAVTA
jgi:hypothetical protein